jgi:hypothetical protein
MPSLKSLSPLLIHHWDCFRGLNYCSKAFNLSSSCSRADFSVLLRGRRARFGTRATSVRSHNTFWQNQHNFCFFMCVSISVTSVDIGENN